MREAGGCASWPEVEAAFDGRFGGREAERVERHVAQCAACRAGREALAALRAEARKHEEFRVTELAARRARTSLLRAAAVGDDRSQRWRWAVAGVGLAAAAATAWARRRNRPVSAAHAVAQVQPAAGTRWRRTVAPTQETIRLEEGALRVVVPHQRAGHRFVVTLPDGEIEVRGTRFVVEARAGRTERVTVTEGLVALRLGAARARLLAAGEGWSLDSSLLVTAATLRPSQIDLPVPTPTPTPTRAARPSPPRAEPPLRVEPTAPPGEAATDDVFARFAAGVDAMGRGDFRVAAEAFAAYERARPGDERAEDAAWLQVVALRRGGDEAGAHGAAERYVTRYPAGAHRVEAAIFLARAAAARGACDRARALLDAAGTRAADVAARCAVTAP